MNKKIEPPNFWSAIIGVIGVIIGAGIGYFGTRTSADAQIRVAQENANAQVTAVWIQVYGPIYTTQTAEVKAVGRASSVPTETLTTSPTTTTQGFAHIRFYNDQISKLEADQFSIDLLGIEAVDSGELFVYGDRDSYKGGGQRSVILKSEDQGLTWNEVFEPIDSNSILFVSFIDQNRGWLLSAWTVEVIGELKLYQTTDSGKNWKFVSKIPMWQWYGYPSRMQFFTPEFGEMDFVYKGGAPGTDKISFMSTSDGGITWSEKPSLPISADGAYSRAVPPRFISFGTDESIWIVNDRRLTDSCYELQMLMPFSTEWQTASRIADDYTFSDGQVSITK